MHKLLERFEHAARSNITLIYLLGMLVGTSAYFMGHALGFAVALLPAVAIAEAVAVELHSWLSQRYTRGLFGELHSRSAASMPYAERDRLERAYRLHFGITCALVGFSMLNSTAFWASQMHPASFGDWLQVGLRGSLIPAFFLLAGFLVPLHQSTAETLAETAGDLIDTMMRAARKQWRKRVRKARRRGANLAEPVALLLEMQEAGGKPASEMVRALDAAIRAAEAGQLAPVASSSILATPPASTPASAPVQDAPERPAPRPPTGPGTPAAAPSSPDTINDAPEQADSSPARVVTLPRKRTQRPAAMKVRAKLAGEALETYRRERVAEILAENPNAKPYTIAKALQCGHKTAQRLIGEYQREQRQAAK